MSTMMTKQKQVERNKRFLFLGTEAVGLGLAIWVTPWLGLPLIALGAYWGWDWFQYRAKHGMRF